jgi:bifunctional polynucleotide phosphatase/kinase
MQPLGYERVNQDLLKTRDKCVKVATQHVENKQPVVVDNTNADKDTRAVWVGLAAKLKVPIRLVHFTAPAKLCEHNDTVRALTGDLVSYKQLVQERLARPAYRVSILTCSRR